MEKVVIGFAMARQRAVTMNSMLKISIQCRGKFCIEYNLMCSFIYAVPNFRNIDELNLLFIDNAATVKMA